MNIRRLLPNALGIIFAAAIAAGGIAIPLRLLDDQEAQTLGRLRNTAAEAYDLVSEDEAVTPTATPMPTPAPLPTADSGLLSSGMMVDRLCAHLSAWNRDGYSTYREPLADELTMEQAVASVENALQEFADAGVFPEDLWETYQFTGAQLSTHIIPTEDGQDTVIIGGVPVPADSGRWSITFQNSDGKGELAVTCDAVTGTIYSVHAAGDEELMSISSVTILNAFAMYFRLADDGWVSYEDTSAVSERLMLSYSSGTSDSYTLAIYLKSDN